MKTFSEWNIDDRRFQSKYVGQEAYLIENGEITKLCKRPVLEITTPTLFSSINACSKEVEHEAANCGKSEPMQGAPVWHGGPAVRMQKVRLG